MGVFSEETINVLKQKERENYEKRKAKGKVITDLFNDGESKKTDPLTEKPEPQMKLYGYEGFSFSAFFDTEEELLEHLKNLDTDMSFGMGLICLVEYMGKMAGKTDVIRKTYSNGKTVLKATATEDHVATYNEQRSYHQGKFVWEGDPGSLRSEFDAFKKRGIEIENDVYAMADDRLFRFIKMMEEEDTLESEKTIEEAPKGLFKRRRE